MLPLSPSLFEAAFSSSSNSSRNIIGAVICELDQIYFSGRVFHLFSSLSRQVPSAVAGRISLGEARECDPLKVYLSRVAVGSLKEDQAQVEVMKHYQQLARQLESYQFERRAKKPGFFGSLFSGTKQVDVPKGMYVYGTVGQF